MKKILIALLGIALLASCGKETPQQYSQIATITYQKDSFFMMKVSRSGGWNSSEESWKITDTSLLSTWKNFPVVLMQSDDSSVILRGKFYVYDIKVIPRRYKDQYNYYFTNGVEAIEFDNDANAPIYKVGDSAYFFYQKQVTFKPKQIK